MEFESDRTQRTLLATTLSVVLFTIVVLGGGTMPLMKVLDSVTPDERIAKRRRSRRKRKKRSTLRSSARSDRKKALLLSKTQEMNPVLETEYSYSEYTETDEGTVGRGTDDKATVLQSGHHSRLKGLAHIDATFIRPFFVRKFTAQEKKEGTMRLTDLALEWYKAAEQDSESDQNERVIVCGERDSSVAAGVHVSLDSSDDNLDHRPLI